MSLPEPRHHDNSGDEKRDNMEAPLILQNSAAVGRGKRAFLTPSRTHLALAAGEAAAILRIALPMILTSLVVYSRSMISMVFLGRLGNLALAGGSLAIGFANITGYSILSGLATGMDSICAQAFGAKNHSLATSTLQRTILLLIFTSLPISLLWINMEKIVLLCGQDPSISKHAQLYLLCSLPDLLALSFLHPLRTYLRSQSITLPLIVSSTMAIILHFPLNSLLVTFLGFGLQGVAFCGVWTDFNHLLFLVIYMLRYDNDDNFRKTFLRISSGVLKDWRPLLNLAIPSCLSVCLEWWWYEIIILLCGLLPNPQSTVAAVGILIQTTSLMYIFPSSLSISVSTRVGNELGANRPEHAKVAAMVAIICSFILGLSATVFAVFVRRSWGKLFTHDKEILLLTSMALPIIGACEIGNCPQTTGCGVLRGSARPKIGANINLCCFYLIGMPVAACSAFLLRVGFLGLWVGLLAAQFSCMISMLCALSRTDWHHEANRAQQLTCAVARSESSEHGNGGEPSADDDQALDSTDALASSDDQTEGSSRHDDDIRQSEAL